MVAPHFEGTDKTLGRAKPVATSAFVREGTLCCFAGSTVKVCDTSLGGYVPVFAAFHTDTEVILP